MSKFNIGDKVTYTAGENGQVGRVIRKNLDCGRLEYFVDFGNNEKLWSEEVNLALAQDTSQTLDEQAQVRGISAAQLLRKAADLLEGDRAKEYGGVLDNHERIAKDWTALFGREFTAGDVAMGMVAVKMSRMDADKTHVDSRVDMLAYKAVQMSYTLLTHSE